MDDEQSFEALEGTDADQLDPFEANNLDDSIRSGGPVDDDDTTEDLEEE